MRALLPLAMVLLLAAGAGFAWYELEVGQSPALAAALRERDAPTLARLARGDLDVSDQQFLGSGPITVTAFVIPGTPATRAFVDEQLPVLEAYAANGTLRYDVRALISYADVRRQTDSYWAAKALSCLPRDAPLRREILLGGTEALKSIPGYAVGDSGPSCLAKPDPPQLLEDISDIRILGVAFSPTLVLGIEGQDASVLVAPGEERLHRRIREYERSIGD